MRGTRSLSPPPSGFAGETWPPPGTSPRTPPQTDSRTGTSPRSEDVKLDLVNMCSPVSAGARGLETVVNHLSSLVLPPQLFCPPVCGVGLRTLRHRGVREAADKKSVVLSEVKDLQVVGGQLGVDVFLGIIDCRHSELDYYLE